MTSIISGRMHELMIGLADEAKRCGFKYAEIHFASADWHGDNDRSVFLGFDNQNDMVSAIEEV